MLLLVSAAPVGRLAAGTVDAGEALDGRCHVTLLNLPATLLGQRDRAGQLVRRVNDGDRGQIVEGFGHLRVRVHGLPPALNQHIGHSRFPLDQQRLLLFQIVEEPLDGAPLAQQIRHDGLDIQHREAGEERQGRMLLAVDKRLHRPAHGLLGQQPGVVFLQYLELGVQPCGDGIGAQDPRAEAVNGADLDLVKLPPALLPWTRGIVPPGPLLDAGADTIAHLPRRLLGEGDGDDAVDGPVRVLRRVDADSG